MFIARLRRAGSGSFPRRLSVLLGLLAAVAIPTAASATELPDGRVYEMVTPVNNEDADIYSPNLGVQLNGLNGVSVRLPFQASLDGNAVTYAGEPTDGGNGSGYTGETLANQYLATRSASGWSQQNISLPADHFRGFYDAFSPDLSVGILQAGGNFEDPATPLLPEAPAGKYEVLYTRNYLADSERSLFRSIPSGVSSFGFEAEFSGGSEDFSTEVFRATAALTTRLLSLISSAMRRHSIG